MSLKEVNPSGGLTETMCYTENLATQFCEGRQKTKWEKYLLVQNVARCVGLAQKQTILSVY